MNHYETSRLKAHGCTNAKSRQEEGFDSHDSPTLTDLVGAKPPEEVSLGRGALGTRPEVLCEADQAQTSAWHAPDTPSAQLQSLFGWKGLILCMYQGYLSSVSFLRHGPEACLLA